MVLVGWLVGLISLAHVAAIILVKAGVILMARPRHDDDDPDINTIIACNAACDEGTMSGEQRIVL